MILELVPGAFRKVSGKFVESGEFKVDQVGFQKYENTYTPKDKAITESQIEFRIICQHFISPS